MTDTVPAPRKQIEQALALVNDMTRFVGVMSLQDYVALDAVPRNLAAILAAPKAGPVGDGAHDQGRFARLGLTSENILDKMSEAATEIAGWDAGNEAAVIRFAIAEITRLSAHPEAPKVEQEPELKADFTRAHPSGMDDATYEEIEDALDRKGAPVFGKLGLPLTLAQRVDALTHPAPASDELVKVVEHQEKLLRAICDAPQPEYVVGHLHNAIHAVNCYVAGLNALRLAKHKGPQS